MSSVIYKSLGDDFSKTNGALEDYQQASQSYIQTRTHYNLREFDTRLLTVPRVMLDMRFWNVESFRGLTMAIIGTPRVVSNTQTRRRTIDDLSVKQDDGTTDSTYIDQGVGDTMTMLDFEYKMSTRGDEQWPAGAAGITVGADPAYRYSNTIRVDLTDGISTIVPSYVYDDILTDFPDSDYYIELVLRDLPPQGTIEAEAAPGLDLAPSTTLAPTTMNAGYLDLDNSFIEFSSDPSFNAAVTDRVAFSESLNDLTSGGDLSFRIMRSRLINSDPSNLRGIRFILTPVGYFTFIAQGMRMLPFGYIFGEIDSNTRLKSLQRSVPRSGGIEPTTIFGTQLFDRTRPENTTIYAKFFSGHHPTGADNALQIFARFQNDEDNVSVRFTSRDTQSRLRLYQTYQGNTTEIYSTTINTNILDELTYYYIKLEVEYEKVRATLYQSDGVLLGAPVYSTGWRLVDVVTRGKIGYSFEPYNYDFLLDFLRANKAEFAHFESEPLVSPTPVAGVNLEAFDSGQFNIFTEGFEGVGDGTLEQGSIAFGRTTTSDKITRSGEKWYGGEQHITSMFIGDSKQVIITGDIFPVKRIRGIYRVALVDQNMSVGFIAHLIDLVPNQWNSFTLRLPDDIVPAKYHLLIHEIGFVKDQFFIDNLKLNHNTVGWEASSDNGAHWQDFLNSQDNESSYLKFGHKGTQLVIRATAHSDRGWISGYKAKPIYAHPGHALGG